MRLWSEQRKSSLKVFFKVTLCYLDQHVPGNLARLRCWTIFRYLNSLRTADMITDPTFGLTRETGPVS